MPYSFICTGILVYIEGPELTTQGWHVTRSMILLMMLQIQFLLIDFRWDREDTIAKAAQQLLHRRNLVSLGLVWKSKIE